MTDQSKLFEHGFPRAGPDVREDKGPVNAICVSCGRERLLSWLIDGMRVCSQCKRELVDVGKKKLG